MYTKHKRTSDRYYNFNYVKYLPKDYDESKKYPLVFFLHGAGERGDDLDAASRHGFMKHVREDGAEYPFIFIAPQCPYEKYWGCYTESLLSFLDYICDTLPVDRDRVYLTGLSMGGTGTWMLAMAAPERFAAIAPICGSGIYWYGEVLRNTPIMVYHGDCDDVVPVQNSIEMIKSVNRHGGNAKINVLYGVGHNAWDAAYSGDELYSWFLSHKRMS
jgi:predicted peptidase